MHTASEFVLNLREGYISCSLHILPKTWGPQKPQRQESFGLSLAIRPALTPFWYTGLAVGGSDRVKVVVLQCLLVLWAAQKLGDGILEILLAEYHDVRENKNVH